MTPLSERQKDWVALVMAVVVVAVTSFLVEVRVAAKHSPVLAARGAECRK